MDLGQNIMLTRRAKKLSQGALGKLIGSSGDVIGRYERNEIRPSIEVASKIADILEVSIDYLIGRTKIKLDQEALNRLEGIAELPEENKKFVFRLLDMALRDCRSQRTYLG